MASTPARMAAPKLAFRLPVHGPYQTVKVDYTLAVALRVPADDAPPCRLWDRGVAHDEQRILLLQPLYHDRHTPWRVFVASVGNMYTETRVVSHACTKAGHEMHTDKGALCWPSQLKRENELTWKGVPASTFQASSNIRLLCPGDRETTGWRKEEVIVPLEY